jgi:hypothetical protein
MPEMIKTKQNSSVVYYFAREGIVKATAYSQVFFWGVLIVAFFLFWLFVGIGGAIGGAIVGALVGTALEWIIAIPKINKWDRLSFKELTAEPGTERIPWSDVSKAVFKTPDFLEVYIKGKRYGLRVWTDKMITKSVLS